MSLVEDKIQVVVADSSRLIGVGLEVVLSGEDDMVYKGQAESSGALLKFLDREKIDVILMDFTSTGFSLESIAEAIKAHPEVRVGGYYTRPRRPNHRECAESRCYQLCEEELRF